MASHQSRILAAVLALVAWVTTIGPVGAMTPAVFDPNRRCVDANDVETDKGYVNTCLDASKADPFFHKILGTSGLHWVNSGFDAVPVASQCVPGRTSREDGWVWKCVVTNGRHELVKVSRWRRPVQFDFAHTSSPSKSAVVVGANTSLDGCRLSASDPRLLAGQSATLSGQSARRTLNTSRLPAGKVTLRVTCRDRRINASSDLLVRSDRSTVLRSDCLDAWHDSKYGDVVPGYGRRMDPTAATQTMTACKSLSPLTFDDYQRAGREAYLKIGQIAEREVRRVSAANGTPVCQAITDVFKPADNGGHAVTPWPRPNLKSTVPIAGYFSDGYFPILFRQWQEGPVRMDAIADCTSGVQALRLVAGTWARCELPMMATEPIDGHQLYPVYSFDRGGCPSSYPTDQVAQAAVCIVWSDRIGNNAVGGTGKVFETAATPVSAGEKPNAMTDLIYDCQDRALHAGQFRNVDVEFMPPLS